MPEYTNVTLQTVPIGANVLFSDTAVPCNKGYVVHREGAGIVTLRGIINGYNNCNCYARYKVNFGANIAVPEDETVGEISLAIAINGEALPSTEMVVTPAAVGEFFNVSRSTFIEVPKNCCVTIAVENTSTIPVDVENANLIIERVS